MKFKIWSYFNFLIHSTNQHGVHSPFVFELVTKCFYQKKNFHKPIPSKFISENTNKKQQILLKKLYNYFLPTHFKTATCLNEPKNIKYDFVIFENTNVKLFKQELKNAHNNTVFVFKNTYKNTHHFRIWKKITALQEVTVSIDTYYLGLIFIRKEQAKQHFKIRT